MKYPENVKALISKMRFGVLATTGIEYPYTSLVAYIASVDLRNIYFATDRDTSKYRNIIRNHKVSFLIYDLGEKSITEGKSVTALGQVSEIEEYKDSKELKRFVKRHPELTKFVNNPDCSFMKIAVHKYLYVDDFQ